MIVEYQNLDELLLALNQSQKETLTYYLEVDADRLESRYIDGSWTVRQILHHLADAESILMERLKRTISNPNQEISAFDQDKWAAAMYDSYSLELSRDLFISCRRQVIHLAEHFYDSLGSNEYRHNEDGVRTLRMEFQKVAWHNAHHLSQIKQAFSN